jgi:hypothetical protein
LCSKEFANNGVGIPEFGEAADVVFCDENLGDCFGLFAEAFDQLLHDQRITADIVVDVGIVIAFTVRDRCRAETAVVPAVDLDLMGHGIP